MSAWNEAAIYSSNVYQQCNRHLRAFKRNTYANTYTNAPAFPYADTNCHSDANAHTATYSPTCGR